MYDEDNGRLDSTAHYYELDGYVYDTGNKYVYDEQGNEVLEKGYQKFSGDDFYTYSTQIRYTYDEKGRLASRTNFNLDFDGSDFLLGGSLPYEFRTTVAQELHSAEDMLEIGRRLRGAKAYFLQNFRDGDTVLRRGLHPLTDEQLRTFKNLLLPYIPATRIRGEN